MQDNSVRKSISRGSIVAEKLMTSEFQKPGTITAQIRQEITTTTSYPSKRVDSNLQANIFDAEEFGFEPKVYSSKETRVAWIPVPTGSKLEDIQAKLNAAYKNGACIYRALSCAPIIDNNQRYAINQGFKTEDDFANAQAVRYPDNETTQADGTANKLILDKAGNVQYRRTFFWLTAKEDVDVRDQEVPYLSAELKAELAGASVFEGQTI